MAGNVRWCQVFIRLVSVPFYQHLKRMTSIDVGGETSPRRVQGTSASRGGELCCKNTGAGNINRIPPALCDIAGSSSGLPPHLFLCFYLFLSSPVSAQAQMFLRPKSETRAIRPTFHRTSDVTRPGRDQSPTNQLLPTPEEASGRKETESTTPNPAPLPTSP